MNGFNNLDETDMEYLLVPTDDLFRFWRSKVKVTAGRQGAKGITSTLGRPNISSSCMCSQAGVMEI